MKLREYDIKNQALVIKYLIFAFIIMASLSFRAFNDRIYIRENPTDPLSVKMVKQNLCSNTGDLTCTIEVINDVSHPNLIETRAAYGNSQATVVLKHSGHPIIPVPPIHINYSGVDYK